LLDVQPVFDVRRIEMPRVALDQIAPNFSLTDYCGNVVSLADFRGEKNVLLVFNRTFT
jgi:peroxiredoxin